MSSAFLWRSSVPLSATDLLAPDNQCIHHLFERQVKATPDAIALLFEDEQISYRQLDQRINYLAYYLQCQGVGPEVVVGLYLERSIDMVISLLAILKAGGAYVPLDPGHPTERLKFIMQDARINIVITQRELATSVAVPIPHIIIVNDKHSTRQRDEISEITSLACDLNLAYVIYTSGSTGKPKGVQLFHRGVINFLLQMRQKLRITSTDKVLAITTLSFDIAVLELLLPLIVGACSVIVPRDTSTDGQQLAKKLRSSGATIMQATPTTWHLLLEAEWQDGQQLTMLCGGEALLPELARRLLSCGKDLWNLYGPTEATVWATIYKVEGVARILPIGFPIRNMEILILDKDLQAAPEGAIGELYISGVGVARGYLNRPDLTAERFVPNPFSQKPGERLYKTGDLARLQANGSIEFLGRNDQQVKVHGYRIELGEIEAVLTQYPDISNGVVIVQGETSEEKYLVAYLIAKQAHAFRPGELRKFLLERLPHYMIPAKFVLLEALPLTPNGKVDRKALPRPENVRHKPLVAPRNALEESIAAIWQDILRVESISIEDNFFEIGGHSLLATRIVARIREAFGIEVSLSNLLLCPVLMQFAQLVEQTLRTKQEERSKTLPVAVPENVSAPLSFTQQALWLFSTLEPENIAYNLPYAYRLKGPLSIWALEQSLQEIMQRHQILRTSFEISGSEPVQLVLDDCKLLFQVVDLLSLSTDARSHIAIELMRMMSRRLFDLSSGPLFRIALFRLGFQEHLLLFTFHHSISDDWSMEVLLQELAMLYPAFVRRETPALSPLPFQYSDFARGQRQWLPDNLASELAYWKEQLDGAPSFLELPTDRPRPSMQTYNGARVALTLPDSLYRPLQDLSNQEGATLFMTLLTAYKILLAYYSGQWEIVVGAAISGRDQPEVERLIGYFVNTLVLRTNLSDRPSFRKALSRVREVCLQAYAHPHVPLDYLVDAVHAERNLSYNSLFQVSFALATFPLDQIEMADVSLQSIEIDNGTVQCDLQMWLTQANKGITGYIEYNTDLFDASTAVRMCQHFHVLLEKIVAQPDIPLSEITLLSSVEQRTILYDWNTTQTAYAQDSCLHQIFEVRAEAMPEAIALIFGSQHMSYGELNRRANQLAHYLQDQGVGPDVLVGLCLERSVEMIVAVLAILKAGGAYVPLDPQYPPERLQFIMQDTALKNLITTVPLRERMTWAAPARFMCLDQLPELSQQQDCNPKSHTYSENLAYIIYTSGSTGYPKGAMLAHKGVVNLIWAQVNIFQQQPASRILQFSSLNFDASLFEIVMAWGAGTILHLAEQEVFRSGPELISLLYEQAITTLTIPPSILSALSFDVPPAHLQTLICAGEPCPASLVATWAEGRHMFNAYGPTETTVWASVQPCLDIQTPPPIGHPIANVKLYVLDPCLQPVPVGVPGELYIGGAGLARGYFNRPAMTAERFIPHPFSTEPGERLYKTGDIVSYLDSGAIEYIGRNDEQIKLRGFRVELGEIDATLRRHPAIRDCALLVREDEPGNKRLVAYVVMQPASTFSPGELRVFLEEHLPGHMIPSFYVPLVDLPLSPNGKLDRRSLPVPEQSETTRSNTYVAPTGFVEKLLADIWSNVLKVERIGIYEHFFELGGDSILAISVCNQARQAGLKITPRQLFRYPTIAALAFHAFSATGGSTQAEQGFILGEAPLTPIQSWFFAQQLPNPHHWNMAWLLQLKEKLSPAILEKALGFLLQQHDALRLRFFRDGQRDWQQKFVPPDALVPFTLVDLAALPEAEQSLTMESIIARLQTSLHLTCGPLIRATLFTLGPQRLTYLFLVAHHLVVDAVSWHILLEDLQKAYRQFAQGKPLYLMKTASFKQWASLLHEYVQSQAAQEELDYWLAYAQETVPRLPADYSHGLNLEATAADVLVHLDGQETRMLLREMPIVFQAQVTDILLTALALAVKQWTGQSKVAIDLEGHGREEIREGIDLTRTVGWFTTLTPLVLDLVQAQEPEMGLQIVKKYLQRLPEKGIGYGVLRFLSAEKEVRERLKALSQAEISFNYLGSQELEETDLWRPMQTFCGPYHSQQGMRPYLIEVNCFMHEGKLSTQWTYSSTIYNQTTIAQLAQEFQRILRSLLQPDQVIQASTPTPAQFPKARTSQKDLIKVLSKVKNFVGDEV